MSLYKHFTGVIIRRALCFGLLFTLFSEAYAETATCRGDTLRSPVTLHFRFDSDVVDSGYMDNSQTLRHLSAVFSDSGRCSTIDFINIYAFASPEGNRLHNERLARSRALAVKGYLVWKYPYLDQYRIHPRPQGENWQGLLKLIEEDKEFPCREEALKILEGNKDKEQWEALLMKLDDGVPYRYIRNNMMPRLRNAAIGVIWREPDDTPAPAHSASTDTRGTSHAQADSYIKNTPTDQLYVPPGEDTDRNSSLSQTSGIGPENITAPAEPPLTESDTLNVCREVTQPISRMTDQTATPLSLPAAKGSGERRPLLALKTNLLFDAALMPNIEIEVPIGKRWSVNGEYMFPWWVTKNNRYCLQILSGGLEGRYWLGSTQNRERRETLTGHFIGLYTGIGKYDLQWKESGYQGEFFIAAGLSYGWATKIVRNLHLELSVGIGLLRTDYRHYHAINNYQTLLWQENGKYTWFGPTKAKISLVWMLTRKAKKGGAR